MALHPLVDANLDWLEQALEWEGQSLLVGKTAWAGPPTASSVHAFEENYVSLPGGRGMWVCLRTEDSQPWVDLWALHYWGQITLPPFPANLAPASYSINDVPSAIVLDERDVLKYQFEDPASNITLAKILRFGHGQAVLDRVRIRFHGVESWTVEEVENITNEGPLLPFYGMVPAPAYLQDKVATLQFDINKWASKAAYTEFRMPTDRLVNAPGKGGLRDTFGLNLMALDQWAAQGGTAQGKVREKELWGCFRKHANKTGQFVQSDGSLWDPTDSRWDRLVIDAEGKIHAKSSGYGDQAWFRPADGNWMGVDPSNGSRVRAFVRTHWDLQMLCQVVERHADPGLYRLVQHAEKLFLGASPTVVKGTSDHLPKQNRSNGRRLLSASALWHQLKTQDLLDFVEITLALNADAWDATGPHLRRTSAAGRRYYAAWEVAIEVNGTIAALTLPINAALRARIEAHIMKLCRFVLLGWNERNAGRGDWAMYYEMTLTGSPNIDTPEPRSAFGSNDEDGTGTVQYLKNHRYGELTPAERAKVDGVLAHQVTNATGRANVWPQNFYWWYQPPASSSVTGTGAVTATKQRASGQGKVGKGNRGSGAVIAKKQVATGSGATKTVGTGAVTASKQTASGTGAIIGGLIQRGSGHVTARSATATGAGRIGIRGDGTAKVIASKAVAIGYGTVEGDPNTRVNHDEHLRDNAIEHIEAFGEELTYIPRGVYASSRTISAIITRGRPERSERSKELVWQITVEDHIARGITNPHVHDRIRCPRFAGRPETIEMAFHHILRSDGTGLIEMEFQA